MIDDLEETPPGGCPDLSRLWNFPRLPYNMSLHDAQQAVNHLRLIRRMMSECRCRLVSMMRCLPPGSPQTDQYLHALEGLTFAMRMMSRRSERITKKYL